MQSAPASSQAPAAFSAIRLRLTPTHIVVIALLCATAVKMAWALTSIGSVDVLSFYYFARGIEKVGLCALYSLNPQFNHTPLTGGFILLLYRAAAGDVLTFAFLLRLAGILADAAVVLGLLRWRSKLNGQPPWWALVLFALSPVSIMISGFHGNVDPIMTGCLFFAAMAAVHERPVLCGLLFGLACNVKIVPIAFGSIFFFFWLHRARLWRFAGSTGAVLLAGAALPLVVNPTGYLRNVFGYGSYWGMWGIPYILRQSGWSAAQTMGFFNLNGWQTLVASGLKFTIIAGILWLGWQRRRTAPASFPATLGMAWVIFFVFAPGAAVQYMVWLAPFLLLLDSRGYLAVTLATTAFSFVFYQACSGGYWPWVFAAPRGPEVEICGWWGLVVWLIFVGLLASFRLKNVPAVLPVQPSLETAPAGARFSDTPVAA
jgi:hypothetical protein